MSHTVDALYAETMRLTTVDLKQAQRTAGRLQKMAEKQGEARSLGLAQRALGHVAFLRSRHREAVDHYSVSIGHLAAAGLDFEEAVTRSGAIVALIYLAEYDLLADWAARARAVFEARQDRARLARLEGNLAFAAFRQDRFAEACALYKHAHREFEQVGRPVDVSTALWNVSTCLISMGEYSEAAEAHRQARVYSELHGLPLQTAAIDYNVAYLHYLCGDYTDAMELYHIARKTGQPYRRALCDLDEAEMYLELNLHRESAELAQRAIRRFRRLEMPYEQGKATAFLAIAEGQQGRLDTALRGIASARRTFRRERNPVWLALLDLYQAVLLDRQGNTKRARQAAERAQSYFAQSDFPAKAAICQLLLARLDLRLGRGQRAYELCCQVSQTEAVSGSASLDYQASQLTAEVLESMGRHREARLAFEHALGCLERLRFRLRGDEIKIAFLKDKVSVYDQLFWLTLTDALPDRVQRAFRVAELAKSRSMAEQVRGVTLPGDEPRELLALRQELDVLYQQVQREESSPAHAERAMKLRDQTRRLESALTSRLAALNAIRRSDQHPGPADPWDTDALRAWLPDGTHLVEFFVSRGTLFAFLADRQQLRVWPLAPIRRIQELTRLLRFQLSPVGGSPLIAQAHLRQLYDELLSPLRHLLQGEHLAIVPHGVLHGVPFAALHDGDSFLLDRFAISYAPSADLLRLTAQRPPGRGRGSLIAGVADAQAPAIAAEAQRLAERLPDARLLLGAEANSVRLRAEMRTARVVHLAAHGYFQRENPLFSAIRLSDSWLTVFDLYRTELVADLVTLSGCSTGVSEVVGADELVGLVRGLLQAGARAALVSLWDVHDGSTLQFMENFYHAWLVKSLDPAQALRRASLDLRTVYPDVFHWAAFSLVGLGSNK